MSWICSSLNSIQTISSIAPPLRRRRYQDGKKKSSQTTDLLTNSDNLSLFSAKLPFFRLKNEGESQNLSKSSSSPLPSLSTPSSSPSPSLSDSSNLLVSSSTSFFPMAPSSNPLSLFNSSPLSIFSLQSFSNDLIPLVLFLNNLDWVSEPLLEYQRNLLGKPKGRSVMLCYCLKPTGSSTKSPEFDVNEEKLSEKMSEKQEKLSEKQEKTREKEEDLEQALVVSPGPPLSTSHINSIENLVKILKIIVQKSGKELNSENLLQNIYILINLIQNFESFSSLNLKLECGKSVFSVDLVMILTDIMITGTIEFFDSFFQFAFTNEKENEKNEKNEKNCMNSFSNSLLFTHSHVILPIITECQRLTQSLGSLWVYLTPSSREPSLLSYSHYLLKLAQFIGLISNALTTTFLLYSENLLEENIEKMIKNSSNSSQNTHYELFFTQFFSLFHSYLSSLIQLLSELLACIPKFKSLVTIQSLFFYIVSIRLWQIVEFLLAFIRRIRLELKKILDFDSFSDVLGFKLSNSTVVVFNSYLNLWDLWERKLKNLYQSILPQYEEIMSELIKKEKKDSSNTIVFQGQMSSFFVSSNNTVGNITSSYQFNPDVTSSLPNLASSVSVDKVNNNLSHIILKKINPNYLETMNNMNILIAEAVDENPANLLMLYKGRAEKEIRKKRLINLSLGKDIYLPNSVLNQPINVNNPPLTATTASSFPFFSPHTMVDEDENLLPLPPLISENFHERFLLLSLLKRLHSFSPLDALNWIQKNDFLHKIDKELVNFSQENYLSLYTFLLSLIQSVSPSSVSSNNLSSSHAFPSISSPKVGFSYHNTTTNFSSYSILSSLFPLLSKILLRLSFSLPRGSCERIPDLFFTTPLEFTRLIMSQWKKREAYEEFCNILEIQQHQQKEIDHHLQLRQSATPSPLLFASNPADKQNNGGMTSVPSTFVPISASQTQIGPVSEHAVAPTVSPTAVPAAVPTAVAHNFTVGQKVDGLFKLSNGTKRWFPATISAISSDNPPLFDLLYDDGDSESGKKQDEVREVKKKLKFAPFLPPVTQNSQSEMNEESEITSPPLHLTHTPRINSPTQKEDPVSDSVPLLSPSLSNSESVTNLDKVDKILEDLPVKVTYIEDDLENSKEMIGSLGSPGGVRLQPLSLTKEREKEKKSSLNNEIRTSLKFSSSNDEDDFDFDEEEDGIFAIPSVFDSISRPEFAFKIPPMRLDLNTPGEPHGSLNSSHSDFHIGQETNIMETSSSLNIIGSSSRMNLPTLEISSLTRGSSYSSLNPAKISSRSNSNQLTLRYSSVLPPIDPHHFSSSASTHNILSSRNLQSSTNSPFIHSKHLTNHFSFHSSATSLDTSMNHPSSTNSPLLFDDMDTYTLNNFSMYSYCFLFITLRKFFSESGLIDYHLCQSDNLIKIFQENNKKKSTNISYCNTSRKNVTGSGSEGNSETFIEASNLNQLESSLAEWLFVYREFFELSSSATSTTATASGITTTSTGSATTSVNGLGNGASFFGGSNFKVSSLQGFNTKHCNLHLHYRCLAYFLPVLACTSSIPSFLMEKYLNQDKSMENLLSNLFYLSGGESDFVLAILRLLSNNLFTFSYPIYTGMVNERVTSNKLGEGGFGAVFALNYKPKPGSQSSLDSSRFITRREEIMSQIHQNLGGFPTFGLCLQCYRKKISQVYKKKMENSSSESSSPSVFNKIKPSSCQVSLSSSSHSSLFLNEKIDFSCLFNCQNCYKTLKINNKKEKFQFSTTKSFAVKKITRERNRTDSSTLLFVINEVQALQTLRGLVGVAYLHEYSVWKETQSYCMVIERGYGTLGEWRSNYKEIRNKLGAFKKINEINLSSSVENSNLQLQSETSPRDSLSSSSLSYDPFHPLIELHLLLSLYLDILLIFYSIHERNITHFDIKGSNILMRNSFFSSLLTLMKNSSSDFLTSSSLSQFTNEIQELHLSLIQAHALNAVSGEVFITDFGEALTNCTEINEGHSLRQRSRGTLVIQAPEVLAVNDQHNKIEIENNCAEKISLREALTKPSFFHTNSFALPRIASKIFTDLDFEMTELLSAEKSGTDTTSSTDAAKLSPVKVTAEDSGKVKKKFPLPSLQSDYWSLGCLFGEILSGELLLTNHTWPELFTLFCLSSAEDCEETVRESYQNLFSKEFPENSKIFLHDFPGKKVEKNEKNEENSTKNEKNLNNSLFSTELLNDLIDLPLSIMQQMPTDRLSLSGLISNTSSCLNKLMTKILSDTNHFNEKTFSSSSVSASASDPASSSSSSASSASVSLPVSSSSHSNVDPLSPPVELSQEKTCLNTKEIFDLTFSISSSIPYILSNKIFFLEKNNFLSLLLQTQTKSSSFFSTSSTNLTQNSIEKLFQPLESSISQPPLIDSNIWLRSGPLVPPTSPHSDVLFPFLSLPELLKDHQTQSFPLLISEFISDNLSADYENGVLNHTISMIWVEFCEENSEKFIISVERNSQILHFKINSKEFSSIFEKNFFDISLFLQEINQFLDENLLFLKKKNYLESFPSLYFTFSSLSSSSVPLNTYANTTTLELFSTKEMNSQSIFFLYLFSINYFLYILKISSPSLSSSSCLPSVMSHSTLLIRQFLLNTEVHEGLKDVQSHPFLHFLLDRLVKYYD